MMDNLSKTMDKIVAYCKGRGFIYSGSEIYGGLANSWDYGPLGVELKNNVKRAWWKRFVQESPYNVGLDSAILMNPQVWVASGHVVNFNDPLIDCKHCRMRHRADTLVEEWNKKHGVEMKVDGLSNDALYEYIVENGVTCPGCGKSEFTPIRKFNMMFKTFQGVTEDSQSEVYLRPETAQGIFVNFRNVQRRSGNPSATRSRRATLRSVRASSSRWSWNSSASRGPIWNGSLIGRTSAGSSCLIWACARNRCACATTTRRS